MIDVVTSFYARLYGRRRAEKAIRAVEDASLAEVRRQLACKTVWYGSRLVEADRWYPSSKICSRCGGDEGGTAPRGSARFSATPAALSWTGMTVAALSLQSYGVAVLNGSTGSSPEQVASWSFLRRWPTVGLRATGR